MACVAFSVTPLLVYSQSTDQAVEAFTVEITEPVEQEADPSDSVPAKEYPYENYLTLARVHSLIELGTIELAYRMIVDAQPDFENAADRNLWEQLFFELGWELGERQALIARSDEVANWQVHPLAQTYAARAEVQLEQYENALRRIRKILLQQPEDRAIIIELRALVTHIYLQQGHLSEAQIALKLFDRDYRPSDPAWEHRYVRVLFRVGDIETASSRLAPLQTLESQLLDLYAQYRTNVLSPSDVVLQGLEIEPQFDESASLHAELWGLIELAARSYNDFEMQTTAIESALSINFLQPSNWDHLPLVPFVSVQQLLDTYDQYAKVVGNDVGLIMGDDESWYQLAQEFEITSPPTARALHAYLARHAHDEMYQERSTAALALLYFEAQLYELLDRLYVKDSIFSVSKVSSTVLTRLANSALRDQDFENALKIIDVMPAPQEAEALEAWHLTQARIAISIFDFSRSEHLLVAAIDQLPPMPVPEAIDRIKQVVFDLQDHEQHELAIRLFVKLYDKAHELQQKREMLRWISESYLAEGHSEISTERLLQSATLGGNWNDDWGLSARLKAADQMVAAGLIEDARVIYTQLQEDTIDPRKRSLVLSRLNSLPKPAAMESR